MEFHPAKCNVLRITRKKNRITFPYTLHGHVLEEVASAKYLGITMTNDMTWNEHIGKTASKANKKLGFLRRNIKTRDQSLKEKAYKTIVRPTMEYCSTVWDPYYETHSDTLEKVQRRAARWVTGRFHNMSSPSAMIQDLGWRDLNQRRADSRLCMLYKISQGLVDIPIGQYLKYSRDGVHFQTIYARTKYYEFSFSLVLSLLGMNFPTTPFRLQIWRCSNRTLSLLIISCPGHTNHYLTPCFYPSLLLTLLSFSFSSPFITNNPCSYLHSRTQPISISLDGRLYT